MIRKALLDHTRKNRARTRTRTSLTEVLVTGRRYESCLSV